MLDRRDPAVHDVADDGHVQPVELAELFPDREHVEEPLRGVLVGTVSGIDHRTLEPFGKIFRSARAGVADNDDIALHGFDVPGRIEQGLALGHAAGRRGDVDHVGRKPFSCKFKGRPRTGARFVEEVDDRLAAERRHFLDVPLGHVLERRGSVEDEFDLISGHAFDAEQVFCTE